MEDTDTKSDNELKVDYIVPTPISETSIKIKAELEQEREDAINYFGYILNQHKFK